MDISRSTEYQNHPVIVDRVEGLVGGGTIKKTPLSSTDELKPGAVVGIDTNGLLQVLKTAKLHADVLDDATAIQVKKGHEFKVGDHVAYSALTGAAYAITEIDTSDDDYDELTVGTTLGVAMTAGNCIVEAAAEAAANPVIAVSPEGITENAVDLSKDNQPSAVMVRGTVNETQMPYYVDASIKALMPLIRFK